MRLSRSGFAGRLQSPGGTAGAAGLAALSIAEWRHHPGRHAAALLAVTLGVALALAVQLINNSALAEFSAAVRSTSGEPDLILEAVNRSGVADSLLDDLAADAGLAVVSPVIELDTQARCGSACAANAANADNAVAASAAKTFGGRGSGGRFGIAATGRFAVHVVGVDALRVAALAPGLMPQIDRGGASDPGRASAATADSDAQPDAPSLLDPDLAYLNAAAQQSLGLQVGDAIELLSSTGWQRLRVAGHVGANGAALVVVDIAAAQSRFGQPGRLTRIDLRLANGVSKADWLAGRVLPAGVRVAGAQDAVDRAQSLSRAYRVNLSVLALVALAVGGFLVYSVTALSVAQRSAQFALLGVLGLAAGPRQRLVLAESAALGAVGSALGVALGIALAALALRTLGGDLGGGYFGASQPVLRVSWVTALVCAALGIAATLAGAWWPSRQAALLSPADALKGLGTLAAKSLSPWWGLGLIALGCAMGVLPAIDELPLAAYLGVALLLGGGVLLVPGLVALLLALIRPQRNPLLILAVGRARFARGTASAAVAGVVASLALSVALTVMVASFRDAVAQWLGAVLPADLYLRCATTGDQAFLPAELVDRIAKLPGVDRLAAARSLPLSLRADRPAVALIARELADPLRSLPLVGPTRELPAGELGVWVSEGAAAIHHLAPGDRTVLPLPGANLEVRVRGVWRDYARQFGAIAIALADYRRATGDQRVNDLAIWLHAGASAAQVSTAARALAGDTVPLDSATTADLRRISLAIFDRSFAVTVYLQAVAIAVGLIGIAASLSAQVLARRKEFGLLSHLGLTRRQILLVVGGETLVWLAAGSVLGLAVGTAIAALLVWVVNPQSFHWTMDLVLPLGRLSALVTSVVVAGTLTALISARGAGGASAVMAVKEDW